MNPNIVFDDQGVPQPGTPDLGDEVKSAPRLQPLVLTPAEAELVVKLMEECGEVIQACSKALRHGLDSYWPEPNGPSNQVSIERELGDVRATIAHLAVAGVIRLDMVDLFQERKLARMGRYMHGRLAGMV